MHQRLTLVLLCIVILGCGRKGPPIDALVKAIDSAETTVWQPVEGKADTLHHSLFYDSVLHYAEIAVQVESEKRRYAQAIIDLAPLLPQNLDSWGQRKFGMDSLSHYSSHANLWQTSLDFIFVQYSSFMRRTLDTLYHGDSSKYAAALPNLFRRSLFEPSWRPRFDSIESAIIAHTIGILRFVDANKTSISIDTILRFSTPELTTQYQLLGRSLDSLTRVEAEVAKIAKGEAIDTLGNVSF